MGHFFLLSISPEEVSYFHKEDGLEQPKEEKGFIFIKRSLHKV